MTASESNAAPSGTFEKAYEPTPREQQALEAQLMRRKGRKPAPGIKVTNVKGVAQIALDHPDPKIGATLLMEALGTTDSRFVEGLLGQLANVATQGRDVDEAGLNFMLAIVTGIEPRDHVEAMLALEMAAVHSATMTFARRLAHVENIPQQDSAERAFNKLARTFAAQVEALKRYRTGGEQRVIVQHVSVSEGGQAIVGNVNHGSGGRG